MNKLKIISGIFLLLLIFFGCSKNEEEILETPDPGIEIQTITTGAWTKVTVTWSTIWFEGQSQLSPWNIKMEKPPDDSLLIIINSEGKMTELSTRILVDGVEVFNNKIQGNQPEIRQKVDI